MKLLGIVSLLTSLITSAPMLQNYAETSIGVTFAVSDMANGYVVIGEKSDLSDGRTVKCGGFRQTGMDDKVIQVRITGLKPSTKYYYRIGADRIDYRDGHHMYIVGKEQDERIYSFTTAGKGTREKFAVINDTHSNMPNFNILTKKIKELNPECVIWNGDAISTAETIGQQINNYLTPRIEIKDYAACTPFLLCPGNHENRGLANRHLERIWMYRQPEERSSRDWDLGRNFAIRQGCVALIGLDTSEDKMEDDERFAGLFNIDAYRNAQTEWLKEVLKRPDIKSARYIVTFCHIPLYDSRPEQNPGDVSRYAKGYTTDFTSWQRTCQKTWGPLLEKAGCKVVISGHQHRFRYENPGKGHNWLQIVGGGHNPKGDDFPTIVEGAVKDGKLTITVYNAATGAVLKSFEI